MRPRHKAAEYRKRLDFLRRGEVLASMRPRHKAAEYPQIAEWNSCGVPRFNEAAA